MQRFTELLVWKRSHAAVLEVYRATARFPSEERFGLTSQLRRAMLSVPTNIAEGSKRLGRQDYARFLNVAEGSLAEAEYLLMVSADLGYLQSERASKLGKELTEIARMLSALRKKVAGESIESRER
jgi:four helix bundle protein